MTNITLLRAAAVIARRGRSRSQLYRDIDAGVLTPPVHVGAAGAVAVWPEHELDAIAAAEIGGASPDELRKLVRDLIARRAQGRAA